ncbi:MAG: hypothetical protein AAFW84_33795 [Cyanobacteria bacterium J06635_15]
MESQDAIAHNPIQVLIVDDEDIVRYGLKAILQRDQTLKIVGEAHNGEVAIAQARTLLSTPMRRINPLLNKPMHA